MCASAILSLCVVLNPTAISTVCTVHTVLPLSLILSACMQEGYGTCLCVCVCVCLSVTTLAATLLVSTFKITGVCTV